MSMEEAVARFCDHLIIERGLAQATAAAYRSDLLDAAAALRKSGISGWGQANREQLLDYLGSLQIQGDSSATLARRLVALKMLYRFLASEKLIANNVTAVMDSPKLWRLLPDFLTETEVDAFISAFSNTASDPLELRNRAIMELLYSSGLRVSELTSLPLGAVDFDTEIVRVTGKGSKTRIVPVGKPALHLLRRYLKEARPYLAEKAPRSPYVFLSRTGKKLDRERIWALVKLAAQRAGITKEIHPHTLRHSFASHLLAHGADLRVIQEMLGHANISTTEIYTHVDRDKLVSLHRRLHPRG